MTTQRSLFSACLLLLFSQLASAQDWTTIPSGTNEDLLAVENTSFATKWIVGTGGYAALSNNDRTAWNIENVNTTFDLLSIIQPALGQVWVGAGAGRVRKFESESWVTRDIPNSTEDFSIFTRNSGAGIAVGTGGSIYRSTDHGMNWTSQSSGTSGALRSGAGFVTSTAYIVGDDGYFIKTTDGGTNWNPISTGTSADLYDIMEGAGTWLTVVGENGVILQSGDSGATWIPRDSGTTRTLRAVSASKQNSNWMVAVGHSGTVIKSTDAGATWCHLNSETTEDLFCVEASSNAEYIIVGANGLIKKTTTGGGACFDPSSVETLPTEAEISRLHVQNPIREVGRVFLQLERPEAVHIGIFDAQGRDLGTLFGAAPNGSAEQVIEFRPQEFGLRSGVYYLRLQGESVRATRAITILR